MFTAQLHIFFAFSGLTTNKTLEKKDDADADELLVVISHRSEAMEQIMSDEYNDFQHHYLPTQNSRRKHRGVVQRRHWRSQKILDDQAMSHYLKSLHSHLANDYHCASEMKEKKFGLFEY
jgi:hypothetical protein